MSKKLTSEEKLARQRERKVKADVKKSQSISGNRSKMYLTETQRELISKEVGRIVTDRYDQYVEDAAKLKLQHQLAQTPEEQAKRIHDRCYTKFSVKQLVQIFGGWYTLRYLFSIKNANPDGTESEMDFYICSQDVSLMDINSRLRRNEPIFKQFGVEVYGYAIIAPAAAFG